MNSALAALIGLVLSIVLIIRKLSPVYSLILGALVGGLLAGWGLETTVAQMISGVKDITPAIVRIIAAGVLLTTFDVIQLIIKLITSCASLAKWLWNMIFR